MSRARALLAAVPVLALVLGGCSGDREPKFEPTPSASASSSTAESSAPADAVDAVKAWVEAQNTGLKTGDLSSAERLAAPGCEGCSDFTSSIQQVYSRGGHFETSGWRVLNARARNTDGDPVRVDVAVEIAGGRTVPKAGARPIAFEPDHRIMRFEVTKVSDHYAISFVGFVQ